MPLDIHLQDILSQKDIEYGGENLYKMFGPSSLTWPTITDSSRMYMSTSQVKQHLSLTMPEIPRLCTGIENSVSRYNTSYKKMEGDWVVKKIIPKFDLPEDADPANQIYMMVLYNKKTDTYDMIEKPVARSLAEKFGYLFNTKKMDSLKEGDKIKNETLYKSTAYDDNGNYRYGKNARVYHSTSTHTIEDAVRVRRGWAEETKSVLVDVIRIPINDNDVLLNMRGDKDNYKPFPDIGEICENGDIATVKRVNKAHVLFDFQYERLLEPSDIDTDYHTIENAKVYDIDVYYNGEDDFPDNIFYKQLRKYWVCNQKYAKAVLAVCEEIKASGSKRTHNVKATHFKYKHYTDKGYDWTEKDKSFGHIVLEIKVYSIVSLDLGSKLVGRSANKGVHSGFVEDAYDDLVENVVESAAEGYTDEQKAAMKQNVYICDDISMPYYMVGDRKVYCDVMLNSSGPIRRLITQPITEVEFNYIAERVQFMIQDAPTMEEKENLLFRFLGKANHKECLFFRNLYDSYDTTFKIKGINVRQLSQASKEAFIRDVEENGFIVMRPPHQPLLMDDIISLYEEFPEITPTDIYIDMYGISKRKMIRKGIIGHMYLMVLKQNSNKNFSARSTFRVNRSNLPAKDIAKKTNRSSYARTPVRLSEIYNILAAISGRDLAEYNIFMRSSTLGRKSLDQILNASGNPFEIKKLKVMPNFTNTNAQILAARTKCIGLRLKFSANKDGYDTIYDGNQIVSMQFGPYIICDKPTNRLMYVRLFAELDKWLRRYFMVEEYKGQKLEMAWEAVFNDSNIKKEFGDRLTDEIKNLLIASTKSTMERVDEILKAKKSRVNPLKVEDDERTPRRRGRKSKAEKEREALELQKQLYDEEDDLSEQNDTGSEETEIGIDEFGEDSEEPSDYNDDFSESEVSTED